MEAFIAELILAFIQGLTEWFPVSSSGHLVLFSRLLGYENSIAFDVAVHFGTLMAVFVYFGRDVTDIVEAYLRGRWKSKQAVMGYYLLIATIPGALIGYFLRAVFVGAFSSLTVVALGFGITSLLLFIASLDFSASGGFGGWKAFLIGCAQAFAILPGVSRSGSTIASGLLLGLNEKEAVRFSFLMAIPIIFGAGLLELGNSRLPPAYLWATLVAFGVGLATIHLLLRFLGRSRKNLRWFALYALLLALGLGTYLLVA
ncbi:MAG TPA: undecaprenyl-diphosphate phosphatase [Candidatus Nanoarchaeia archaeon]|nr:undecaprenyl-diphosphate phosphatase [Candidatus Nanoarchaeia archaeon]